MGTSYDGQARRTNIISGKHSLEKREFSLYLRREMTPSETLLWNELRTGRLHGVRFRRQQIIDGFIVDFFCHSAGLIVEVDGSIHDKQKQEDEDREEALRKRHLRILRFTNEQIKHEITLVLQTIQQAVEKEHNAPLPCKEERLVGKGDRHAVPGG